MSKTGGFVAVTLAVGVVAFALMYWVMDLDPLYSALITFGYIAVAMVVRGMRSKKEDA